jgi:hypothetical protein
MGRAGAVLREGLGFAAAKCRRREENEKGKKEVNMWNRERIYFSGFAQVNPTGTRRYSLLF